MTAKISSAFRRSMRRISASSEDPVHFHVDGAGRAFACDLFRCDSPGLTLREASLTETGARRQTR
jgi:hypothetical protein